MKKQMMTGPVPRRTLFVLSLLGAAALAGCKETPAVAQGPMPAPVVSIQTIEPQLLVTNQTLVGRATAQLGAEVRPQIGGVILEQLFKPGQAVNKGQALYQIDPRPYEAQLEVAKGQLAQAQAAVEVAKPKAERFKALSALEAVSIQEGEEAVAALRQAEASLTIAQAAVKTAQLNLDYTRVLAPIAGVISTSTVTPGALVTANQGAALATIQQVDSLYVDVTQTSAKLLALRKQLAAGTLKAVDGKVQVKLELEDGSSYEHPGVLEFVGSAINETTGAVAMRIAVPNPGHLLLPGAYVKAVVPSAVNQQAILVPQTYVTRNGRGEPLVKVVNAEGVVEERRIQTGEALKDQWVVTDGLKAGDRVITEGGARARAGQVVTVAGAAANAK